MRISDWSPDVCSSDLHDLVALDRNPDVRAAERSLDIHLTGNMERFMWSFDGVKMSDYHEPIPFIEGERVRINLINDSMMSHPIHLHGHFFELVTGKGDRSPRKHTVLVQPGGTASFDFPADAVGAWEIGRESCRDRGCLSG